MIHMYLQVVTPSARWLLLIHQLPKEPAYLRVKIGRRLSSVGAIALKGSVYVLPKSEAAAEDFQWVRREVVAGGGEATVVEAQLVEGLSDGEVEAKFRDAKDAEYGEVIAAAKSLSGRHGSRRKRPLSDEERSGRLTEIARLERRLEELQASDFFGASGHEVAAGLLRELRERATAGPSGEPATKPRSLRARTWVTRSGVHVDRIASAWLIRRFIDAEATFKLVPAKGYQPHDGELRFDMFEAEFSHEGDRCTFETLISRFAIAEPGVRSIAEVVHDIDLKESKFARPETAGVAACIAGLCRQTRDDDERLRQGGALFEALLAHFAASKETRR